MELVLIGVAARPDTLLRFRPWDGSGAGVRAVLPGAACNRSHGSGAFRQQHFQVRLDGQAGRLRVVARFSVTAAIAATVGASLLNLFDKMPVVASYTLGGSVP